MKKIRSSSQFHSCSPTFFKNKFTEKHTNTKQNPNKTSSAMRCNGLMNASHSRLIQNIPGGLPEEREETKERKQNFIKNVIKIDDVFHQKISFLSIE